MTATKNRETGTMIELGHQELFGIENDEYVWLTYCVDHEMFIGHQTKLLATRWSSKPSGWCDGCAELVK